MVIIISAIGSNRVRGNVYFTDFDESEWSEEKKEEHDEFVFVIYRKLRIP